MDVLVESLGLENGNAVQTPITDGLKDENPVWSDSEQIRKYRSHVARFLFLSQDRADITFAVKRVVPKNVRSSNRSVLEGRGTMDPSFLEDMSSEVTGWAGDKERH